MNRLNDLEMFLTCIVVTSNDANNNSDNIFIDASREIDNFELLFGKEVAALLYHHHI